MNILHVIDEAGTGGAETVFINLVVKLSKKFNNFVVIGGEGWLKDQLVSAGIRPILLDAKGSVNFKYLFELLYLVKKNNIKLIHAHLLGSNVYCSIVGLLTGVPVISTFHGGIDISPNEKFHRLKMYFINKGSSRIVAVSHHLKNQLVKKNGLDKNKVFVIYNGVDEEKFKINNIEDIRKSIGVNQNDLLLGAVGNINSAKGYKYFIDAIPQIIKYKKNVKVIIAGEGRDDQEQAIKDQVTHLGLEDIVFLLGFRNDIPNILLNMDIFVLPSVSEGFSIATVEAMICKKPIVVTKSGGPEEIITDGINGILVEPGSSAQLSEAILHILAGNYSKDIINNAYSSAQSRFSLKCMINSYENMYRELVSVHV